MTPLPGKGPPEKAGEQETLVLLGGLCLFLSTLEYLIPKPLPFIRIGLANLPLLLALDLFSPRRFALLTLIKITGAGILGGTIFSYVFLFSLGGGLASALVMYGLGILRRSGPRVLQPGLAGIGAAGALCSTAVQLLLARFLVLGEGVRYLIPPFLAAALITGFALGLFCEYFCRRSRWYALRAASPGYSTPAGEGPGEESAPGPPFRAPRPGKTGSPRHRLRRERWDSFFNGRELAAAGFIAALLFLFNPSTLGRALQFLLFWFCAWFSGRKIRPLLTLLVIAGVLAVNLLAPYGRVLAEIGPLSLTAGSLVMGLRKGITLEGLFMLSGVVVRGRRKKPGLPAGRENPAPEIRKGFPAFRGLLEESLAVFAALREGGKPIRPGRLVEDIDRLLLDREGPPAPIRPDGLDTETHPPPGGKGRPLLILGLLICAALTALPGIMP